MSKHTTTVFLVSAAKIGSWGDDEWRVGGTIQYVEDGPAWLLAQPTGWPGPDEVPNMTITMTVDDDNPALDLAVMVLAMEGTEQAIKLCRAWSDENVDRNGLRSQLDALLKEVAGHLKVGVVHLKEREMAVKAAEQLTDLGFVVEQFDQRS